MWGDWMRSINGFKLLQTYLAPWGRDRVHELKTKFPVSEETAVFMFKFIVLAFPLNKGIFCSFVNLFI